ncbi:MAG: TRAP transporter small permease subunit [Ignavibacteriaceae bacterium]
MIIRFIGKFVGFANSMSEITGKITSWITFLLVLVVSYDVIVRYIFNQSSVALQELEWHLFALIFLVGAAYTLKQDDHVRVDVIYTHLTPQKKALINFLGCLLFLIPFCLIVILSSVNFVEASFLVRETSPDAGGLPARFILKAFIPVSFFFLLIQGIALCFTSLLELLGTKSEMKEN